LFLVGLSFSGVRKFYINNVNLGQTVQDHPRFLSWLCNHAEGNLECAN